MNTNEKQLPELPETINAGDEVEVQIAPFGDWPNVDADGSPLTQSVDGEAVDRMVANFAGDILVDADHQSESGGSTEALAWVTALRADPERGLVGTMRFTDKGAEAVSGRRYRFLSPAWTMDADGRPDRLVSVGLTNKPNLPVSPILNRERGGAGEPQAGDPPEQKNSNMNELKAILGLAEDAQDSEVVAAVQALVAKAAEAKEAAEAAEAEQFAEENADCVEDKKALANSYRANKELTRAIVANVKRPAPAAAPAAVTNSAEAKPATVKPSYFDGCRTPEERVAWYNKNVR